MGLFSASAVLLALLGHSPQISQTSPPPFQLKPRFELEAPLPTVPGVMIDAYANGVGVAQQLARSYNLQARILWIDGTANIERFNTETKIVELVKQIRESGFNTIVFDVKPISGQVLYPSAIAPKLTEWKGRNLPIEFDPLAIMVREAKAANLWFFVSLNAFSEGHKMFQVGPGYTKTDWLTTTYEAKPIIKLEDSKPFDVNTQLNKVELGQVSEFTSVADLPKSGPDGVAVLVSRDCRMENKFDATALGIGLSPLPSGSILLYGTGEAASFLTENYKLSGHVQFDTEPEYVPISDPRELQYPLMVNPNNPDVQRYEISIAQEVVRNYPIDGIIYDDRFRYGGINADFSELTREQFEHHVGRRLTWPDDVFKFTLNKNMSRGLKPGPYYDAWMAWRSKVLHDYLEKVRRAVKEVRPTVELGLYVGSWYGEYPALGDNYASPSTHAGFWFLSPSYRVQGTAPLLDFLISGCYYPTPTIYDALSRGVAIGNSIEAAGMLTNRLIRDECWTYAGIDVNDFTDAPNELLKALQAACASTQGVMVFDLSHNMEPVWPVFAKAFSQRKRPPHASTQALINVRHNRALQDKAGRADPPVIIAAGSAGIGQ
jgi:hypothetical protein